MRVKMLGDLPAARQRAAWDVAVRCVRKLVQLLGDLQMQRRVVHVPLTADAGLCLETGDAEPPPGGSGSPGGRRSLCPRRCLSAEA